MVVPNHQSQSQANRRNILSFVENQSNKANACYYKLHLLQWLHVSHQLGDYGILSLHFLQGEKVFFCIPWTEWRTPTQL